MSNLQKAQRESMKEMDFLCSLYEQGKTDEVLQDFKLFEEVMNILTVRCNRYKLAGMPTPLTDGLTNFYVKFKSCGLVYPKSLVQQVRDELVGWTDHKFIGVRYLNTDVLRKSTEMILGEKVKAVFDFYSNDSYFKNASQTYTDFVSGLRQYIEMFYFRELCGAYRYDPDSKLFKDEGGGSKQVKNSLNEKLQIIKRSFFADFEYSLGYFNKVIDLIIRFLVFTAD